MACKRTAGYRYYAGKWGGWRLLVQIPNCEHSGAAMYRDAVPLPEGLRKDNVFITSECPSWGEYKEVTLEEAREWLANS